MALTKASIGAGASANAANPAPGGSAGPGGWHPSILYLLFLTIAEIFAVAFLSRHLLRGE